MLIKLCALPNFPAIRRIGLATPTEGMRLIRHQAVLNGQVPYGDV
jgi:hypothetical protein